MRLKKYFDNEKTVDFIKEDFQLYMLQTVNDESANCLHSACKLGLNKLVQVITDVAE